MDVKKILAGVQTLPECMRSYMTGMEGGRRVTIGALKNITAPKQLESILEVSNNPAHQQRSLKFEATFMQVMLGRELLG